MSDKKEARKPNVVQPKAAPQFEETLRKEAYPNRKADAVVESGPEKVRAAREAHHGRSQNADGSKFSKPLRKVRTSGGDGDGSRNK
jgi:hypothetical protein